MSELIDILRSRTIEAVYFKPHLIAEEYGGFPKDYEDPEILKKSNKIFSIKKRYNIEDIIYLMNIIVIDLINNGINVRLVSDNLWPFFEDSFKYLIDRVSIVYGKYLLGSTIQYMRISELTGCLPILHNFDNNTLNRVINILKLNYKVLVNNEVDGLIIIEFGKLIHSSNSLKRFFKKCVFSRSKYRVKMTKCHKEIIKFGITPGDNTSILPLFKNGGFVFRFLIEKYCR